MSYPPRDFHRLIGQKTAKNSRETNQGDNIKGHKIGLITKKKTITPKNSRIHNLRRNLHKLSLACNTHPKSRNLRKEEEDNEVTTVTFDFASAFHVKSIEDFGFFVGGANILGFYLI